MRRLVAVPLLALSLGCAPSKSEIQGSAFLTDSSGTVRPVVGLAVVAVDERDAHRLVASRAEEVQKAYPRVSVRVEGPDREWVNGLRETGSRLARGEVASVDDLQGLRREAATAMARAEHPVESWAGDGSGIDLVYPLPRGIDFAISDAEGHFTLRVPAGTRLLVGAVAPPPSAPGTPRSWWVVPVEARAPRTSLLLSDENEARRTPASAAR